MWPSDTKAYLSSDQSAPAQAALGRLLTREAAENLVATDHGRATLRQRQVGLPLCRSQSRFTCSVAVA